MRRVDLLSDLRAGSIFTILSFNTRNDTPIEKLSRVRIEVIDKIIEIYDNSIELEGCFVANDGAFYNWKIESHAVCDCGNFNLFWIDVVSY